MERTCPNTHPAFAPPLNKLSLVAGAHFAPESCGNRSIGEHELLQRMWWPLLVDILARDLRRTSPVTTIAVIVKITVLERFVRDKIKSRF